MRVLCDRDECVHNKNRECTKEMIWLEDGDCDEYSDYTEGAEYQNVYWKNCKDTVDGKKFRLKAKGKKYEFFGHTFYTSNDDRYGLKNVWFTEEISGIGLTGEYFEVTDEKKRQRIIDAIEKGIKNSKPVLSLPEKKIGEDPDANGRDLRNAEEETGQDARGEGHHNLV